MVQTSNNDSTPAGLALAISGHSALSAMARMASQTVNRDDVVLARMGGDSHTGRARYASALQFCAECAVEHACVILGP